MKGKKSERAAKLNWFPDSSSSHANEIEDPKTLSKTNPVTTMTLSLSLASTASLLNPNRLSLSLSLSLSANRFEPIQSDPIGSQDTRTQISSLAQ